MNYLHTDLESVKSGLFSIGGHTSALVSSNAAIADSTRALELNVTRLQAEMTGELQDLEFETSAMFYQIGELIDEVKLYRNQQFMQNKERNALLASIDASLKAPNKTAAQEQYEMAMELVGFERHEQALGMLAEAIRLHPMHFRAHVETTLILMKFRKYEEALHHAKESFVFVSSGRRIQSYVHGLLADIHQKLKNYDIAIEHMDLAMKHLGHVVGLQPGLIDMEYEKIRYQAMGGYTETALDNLLALVKRYPQYFSTALVDPAFTGCRKELTQRLTDLKKSYENDVVVGLEAARKVVFPTDDCSSKNYGFGKLADICVIDDFKQRQVNFMYPSGINGFYDYNKFVSNFEHTLKSREYTMRIGIRGINELYMKQTFEAFSEARQKVNTINSSYQYGYKNLVEYMKRGQNPSPKRTYAYIKEETRVIKERIKKIEKEIKEEKKGYFLGMGMSEDVQRRISRKMETIEENKQILKYFKIFKRVEPQMTRDLKKFCEEYLAKPMQPMDWERI